MRADFMLVLLVEGVLAAGIIGMVIVMLVVGL